MKVHVPIVTVFFTDMNVCVPNSNVFVPSMTELVLIQTAGVFKYYSTWDKLDSNLHIFDHDCLQYDCVEQTRFTNTSVINWLIDRVNLCENISMAPLRPNAWR